MMVGDEGLRRRGKLGGINTIKYFLNNMEIQYYRSFVKYIYTYTLRIKMEFSYSGTTMPLLDMKE